MSAQIRSPRPAPQAEDLAEFMLESVDVQRRVLMETIESAEVGDLRESGRTFCPQGSDPVRGPLGRFPRAVSLARCPRGVSGIMHTHVTVAELKRPQHSLPDVANVVTRDVDASIVVGTESHDVLVSPQVDEEGLTAFQDALGLPVESTEDVIEAIRDGRVEDFQDARDRVRSRLDGLFRRARAGFSELSERVDRLGAMEAVPAAEPITCGCLSHPDTSEPVAVFDHPGEYRSVSECCQDIRAGFKRNERALVRTAQAAQAINFTEVVVSSAIGAVIGSAVSRRIQI